MSNKIQEINEAGNVFDAIKHTTKDGTEYWLARELSTALGYARYENFVPVISRARISMERAGMAVDNHFLEVQGMVQLGSTAVRETDDVKLTRYACYVIAMNGSPAKKQRVAEAQSYFAVQTRKQEIHEQYSEDMKRLAIRQEFSIADKRLSANVMEAGIHPRGLSEIKSEGDKRFFGGNSSNDMKQVYGVEKKTPWANRAPNVVLAGKTLANEMTATNIEQRGITNFPAILDENNENNMRVRGALVDSGIVPEEQQPAEDTEEIKKRIKHINKISPKHQLESEKLELDI